MIAPWSPLASRQAGCRMKSVAAIGAAILERLAAQAAANRASGERLRAEVREVLQQATLAENVTIR